MPICQETSVRPRLVIFDNSIVNWSHKLDRDKAYEITWLIRRLFRALGARADEYLGAAGQTAADRAVMEFLHPHARLSVPEIARRYKVSRQHVQVTVNKLLDQGLLASEENPKHKRSSLIRLSRAGRERFGEIQRTEVVLVDKLFADLSGSDIDVTHRTLRRLLDRLNLGDQ